MIGVLAHMTWTWLGLSVMVLIGSGCSVHPEVAPIAGPADPASEMRPDLIIAHPTATSPNGVVSLTFPRNSERGVLFVLERRADDSWAHMFDLLSDGPGEGWQRTWHSVDASPMGVPAIGVGGPGPDRVLIPETVEPSEYRICTGNAGENFCTPIEIVAP